MNAGAADVWPDDIHGHEQQHSTAIGAGPSNQFDEPLNPDDDDDVSYDSGYESYTGSSGSRDLSGSEDEDDDEEEFHLVRQDSSFKNLSADSWLTVASEYENETSNPVGVFSPVEEEVLKDPKEDELVNEMQPVSALKDRSVLDCVVDLLRGSRAQKKKLIKRYGERWIWLGDNLLTLNWKSKKRGGDQGKLNLTKVRRLRKVDRELSVEILDGTKVVLVLSSAQEATTWLTGLSCLVPKKAKVHDGGKVLKERVNYDPLRDSWRGKAVATRRLVNEYIMLGGIGRGASGQVKLALSTNDKRFYAVKVISNKKSNRPSPMSTPEEQAILRKLDHPNIVKHRDILEDKENGTSILVVEFMARGVVMDSSKLSGVKPLSEDGVRDIMRNVVCGLEYLHQQQIVHRDIKPDNLLRCGDGTVKISDFGEARMYNAKTPDARKGAAPGTPAFIAPELCMSDKCPKPPDESYAADVWSLGATLFYMVYGRVPFLANGVFEIFETICTEKLRFPESPKTSRKLKDLIKKMLTKEPRSRATLQEVARHPWFGGDVVQPDRIRPIRITQADIENAIGKATWTTPTERSNRLHDDDD